MAVVIRPKQPCLDWVNTIPRSESYTMEDISEENTVYLIPNYDKKGDEDEFIKQHYSKIFDFELQGWKGRGTVFPENRTYEMFLEWFHIEVNSEIFDLVSQEIEREEV